jgi:hypothetical protein
LPAAPGSQANGAAPAVAAASGASSRTQTASDNAIDLLTQARFWAGCNATADTATTGLAVWEQVTVDKGMGITRIRQAYKADCSAPANGNWEVYLKGKITNITPVGASSGDIFTYQIDETPDLADAAPATPAQPGAAAPAPVQTTKLHDIIQIHKTQQLLYFGKESPLGQAPNYAQSVPASTDDHTKLVAH